MRLRVLGIAALSVAITVPVAMTGFPAASASTSVAAREQALVAARDARSVVNTVAPRTLAAVRAAAKDPSDGRVEAKATANPKIDETCGLDVTLTLDSSGSISTNAADVKNAATDFMNALKDTNSTMRINRFAKTASQLAPRSPVNATTAGPGGVLSNGIAAYPSPVGGTNWQQGFKLTREGDSLVPELLIFITDGDPTLWGADGTQGTGQVSQPNINNSLSQAIPQADAVKTSAANRTRVLMVGVGNGVNNPSSRLRMTEVSGPNVVTSASGLAGKSINDVDVAAFTDFKALGAFLRSVVTSLCGNSVTVQKLAQSSADAQYLPAPGWDVTVKPTVTGGYSWVDPAGADNTPQTRATAGAQGATAFQWKPKSPSNNASVEVSESVKSGFNANRWECDVKKPDGTSKLVGGKLSNGSPKFTFDMASSDVAACRLYNDFIYSPGISITKAAADDPVRGNGVGWDEAYTFNVTNTGNSSLVVAKPVDPQCSSISAPTGPGAPAGLWPPARRGPTPVWPRSAPWPP